MIFRHLDDEDDALVDVEALSVISKLKPDTLKRRLTAVACDIASRRNLYLSKAVEPILATISPRRRRQ